MKITTLICWIWLAKSPSAAREGRGANKLEVRTTLETATVQSFFIKVCTLSLPEVAPAAPGRRSGRRNRVRGCAFMLSRRKLSDSKKKKIEVEMTNKKKMG